MENKKQHPWRQFNSYAKPQRNVHYQKCTKCGKHEPVYTDIEEEDEGFMCRKCLEELSYEVF